jgi:hypothetical protein
MCTSKPPLAFVLWLLSMPVGCSATGFCPLFVEHACWLLLLLQFKGEFPELLDIKSSLIKYVFEPAAAKVGVGVAAMLPTSA